MARKKNPFAWPFSKMRQQWIATADRYISLAGEDREAAISGQGPLRYRKFRRAARYYEKSAEYYRKAGLGAMASASWQDAAECWAEIGDDENGYRCEVEDDKIDVFYEEDVNEQ